MHAHLSRLTQIWYNTTGTEWRDSVMFSSKQSWLSLGKLWHPQRQKRYWSKVKQFKFPCFDCQLCPPLPLDRLPSCATASMPLPPRTGSAAGSMEACRPERMERLNSASVEKSKQSVIRHNRVETCSLVRSAFYSTVKH